MNEQIQGEFLRRRMVELREKNGKSQSEMADLLFVNKSTLSRVEGGNSSYKTILDFANKYCQVLQLTEEQTKLFLRGEKVIVTDTSALLKNIQLIDELCKEYSRVIVPKIVVEELDNIKDHNINGLAAKAWQIMNRIGSAYNIITDEYDIDRSIGNNDAIIIEVAKRASEEYNCVVDIISNDAGFAAKLKKYNDGEESGNVKALYIEDYYATKQSLVNMDTLHKIDKYYANSYDDIEAKLNIKIPSPEEINAYLPDGNTLIISAVRHGNRNGVTFEQRKRKILWLMEHKADVNKRDCRDRYFPALTHTIQMDDYQMFKFLLHDCHANPNVGSRDPHGSEKLQQIRKVKNDGNMPLMVAAWHNRIAYVKELCEDERTSINQQDANGYTALIKASMKGYLKCRDLILAAGADTKIVDRDGYTYMDRYNEFLETSIEQQQQQRGGWNRNNRGGNRW